MTVELKAKAKKNIYLFLIYVTLHSREFDAKGESKLTTRLHDMLSVP